jgi:hypothetical protein
VKEELARKCGVTISQVKIIFARLKFIFFFLFKVNNWFGNKRGRYKKNMLKNE